MTSGHGLVSVVILEVVTEQTPPATVVRYEMRNGVDSPVWLVSDRWFSWRQTGRVIELGFQRVRMREGVQVFGYFPPEVVVIRPGERLARDVRLAWPEPLDSLWNTQPLAAPLPGSYLVSVRIGYGLTPEPDDPLLGESVEAPVLRWQHEAASPVVSLEVPDYGSANSSIE